MYVSIVGMSRILRFSVGGAAVGGAAAFVYKFSNRPMLAAMLADDGFEVVDLGIVADDEAALTDCFARALKTCDAVVSSGGASDGDEDHTQAAMRNNDVEPVFWRLSIKPGRPMAGGTRYRYR